MLKIPWRRDGTTSEPDGPPAPPPRTSPEWTRRIDDLKSELEALAHERQSLTGSAGTALLDGQAAVVTDLQGRLAAIDTQERIVGSAIAEAESRRAAVRRTEERAALVALEQSYYLQLALYCESRAVIADAEERLAQVRAEQRLAVDQARLSGLYDQVLRAGRSPEPAEQPEVRRRDAAAYRADAARYRVRAGVGAADAAVTEGGVSA